MRSERSGIIWSMTDTVLEDDVRSWDVGLTCFKAEARRYHHLGTILFF